MQRFLSAAGRPRRRAAVLGSPIAHSLSPVLHRAAYDAIGMDWSYEAIECDQAALPATLDRLAGTHVGLSLTMPLKQAVLGLLDDLDPLARQLGAVNTVVYEAGGARRGYNTDVGGALAALAEADVTATGGGSARPSTVLLGGEGRTARRWPRWPSWAGTTSSSPSGTPAVPMRSRRWVAVSASRCRQRRSRRRPP
jgi:shikimate 5-dehydrogenase